MNEILKLMARTHSERNFSDREIPEHDLDAVLQAAVRAATASAMQSYSIIVLREREQMKAVCGYAGSRLLVFCVDQNRNDDLARALGVPVGNTPGVQALLTSAVDTILAAQNACLAGQSLGIDSFFTNGIYRKDLAEVASILGLPDTGCLPLICLVMGYAEGKQTPVTLKGRVCGEGLIHEGRYQRLSAAAIQRQIACHDDPEMHLGVGFDWRAEGFSHYHEWLYRKWLGGISATGASPLLETIRRAGYLC